MMQWVVRGAYVASFRCCSRVQDAYVLSIVSCARREVYVQRESTTKETQRLRMRGQERKSNPVPHKRPRHSSRAVLQPAIRQWLSSHQEQLAPVRRGGHRRGVRRGARQPHHHHSPARSTAALW